MRIRALLAAIALSALATCVSGAPAHAAFGVTSVSGAANDSNGAFVRQAGAHPDLSISVRLKTRTPAGSTTPVPDDNVRDVDVDLPVGLTGSPTATPTCPAENLYNEGQGGAKCSPDSQVGLVVVQSGPDPDNEFSNFRIPLYNIDAPSTSPGLFGFNFLGAVVKIVPRLRAGDYGISAGSKLITQAKPIYALTINLWGVPADPVHNADRSGPGGTGLPSYAQPKPFITLPTSCPGVPATTTLRADGWSSPTNVITRSFSVDADGVPFTTEGCDRLPFKPTLDVQPLSHVADSPTGLDADLEVPQSDAPDGLATAHVRRVDVALPTGMSVSPSAAAGLGACAPSQIGLGTDTAPTCPDSSKIGSVTIDTPLLNEPLVGDVILAAPNNNPFDSLLALYIVARGPGILLKLPGRVDADETTGQLKVSFDNTPQLPFSRLHLTLRGGSRAPLATPAACGDFVSHGSVTSWASSTPVTTDSTMRIDEGCDSPPLAPTTTAGASNPQAGAASPLTISVSRPDRSQYLSRISATLPPGLLANIGSVPQCGAVEAASGGCPYASRIGTVSVLSGPGDEPLPLTGAVYLTGPYGGGPFGLSIVVPTAGQAGPFDLGNVVVRASISVDRTDAHVSVLSDPLPTILKGFPLRLRQTVVSIDRPGFTFNPTNCAAANILVGVTSVQGASASIARPFNTLGCANLPFDQSLSLRLTGAATKDGQHPGIEAHLSSVQGHMNLRSATVKLPLSVALDPDNAQQLCTPDQRAALACPAASIVGTATASSILPDPLEGPVYFVQGLRTSATGRVIKTLPKLWIPLSADGVTIDVNADSAVDSLSRLVTTFRDIPDAPISSFDLHLDGGRHGVIVVSGKPGTCERDRTLDYQFAGQDGRARTSSTQVAVDGCTPAIASSTSSARSVSVRVSNIGPGRLALDGTQLVKTTRTLRAATAATVTARLSKSARRVLRRRGRLLVAYTVRYTPRTGRSITLRARITSRASSR